MGCDHYFGKNFEKISKIRNKIKFLIKYHTNCETLNYSPPEIINNIIEKLLKTYLILEINSIDDRGAYSALTKLHNSPI